MRVKHIINFDDAIDITEPSADEKADARVWFDLVSLPYFIEKLPNGRWVIINRRQKPLGSWASRWVDYSEATPSFAFHINETVATALTGEGATRTTTRIYLTYGPIGTADYWKRLAYLVRLIETVKDD